MGGQPFLWQARGRRFESAMLHRKIEIKRPSRVGLREGLTHAWHWFWHWLCRDGSAIRADLSPCLKQCQAWPSHYPEACCSQSPGLRPEPHAIEQSSMFVEKGVGIR